MRLDDHIRCCADIGAISSEEAGQVRDTFAFGLNRVSEFTPALLHGDPGSHNVFVSERAEVTCLIDWEDALVGDPLFDVAFWATFHPERRWDAYFAGYTSDPRETGDDSVRFWIYFLRVALMKTVLRHRLGYEDLPGRSPGAGRIQRALRGLGTAA